MQEIQIHTRILSHISFELRTILSEFIEFYEKKEIILQKILLTMGSSVNLEIYDESTKFI